MHISKLFSCALLLAAGVACGQNRVDLEAESASFNPDRMEVVEKSGFSGGKSVVLKPGVEATTDTTTTPDITLKVKPAEAGRYVLETRSSANAAGREVLARGKTKYDSLFMMISVGGQRTVRRVVFVPWADPARHYQFIGKFDLTAEEQEIRLWMPAGIELDFVRVSPYVPPRVPAEAASYKPTIVPPESHPRLWVNAETLPGVRANLTRGENAPLWEKLQQDARKPFAFPGKPGEPMEHSSALEAAAVNKAFLYLASGDKEAGREAIALMDTYLSAVEFSNILDITREIGRAMYAGARVYDWCYDLMTPKERDALRAGMMRLADDMEIGWPPFKQIVVNGHGAEAQLFCHLMSMSIAIYSEDPEPYKYCAYRVLEELVPMRNFEYQSPRHNQGLGYGIYRFTWDMHAAWIFYRMSGQKIFDSNIENVHKYWLQTRLPDGSNFPDGDGNADGRRTNLGLLALMASAYSGDPVMKYDFLRQGGFPSDPLMVLLLNDPDLKPSAGLGELPLTFDFGDILGGMVARTGWNMGDDSRDVVAFMTGGGYHFYNHQQADAGSFQVYYGGLQVADLGQYVFYGTPYDLNFNKRSVAHSMMLAYDPDEKMPSARYFPDGGARAGVPSPGSLKALKDNPKYANGDVVSVSYGPAPERPAYSYFSVDLASAYDGKIRDYVRSFCFLNLDDPANPAALIIADSMETSTPEVQKYWQINTIAPPRKTDKGVVLSSHGKNKTGHVHLQMLKPAPADRTLEILSGTESTHVFGKQLTPPKPDEPLAKGHRIMFAPAQPHSSDSFLTVLTMSESGETTLRVEYTESGEAYIINVAGRLVAMSRTGKLLDSAVAFEVSGDAEKPVVLTGLKPGQWKLVRDGAAEDAGKIVTVSKRKNTADFQLPSGRYTLQPQ